MWRAFLRGVATISLLFLPAFGGTPVWGQTASPRSIVSLVPAVTEEIHLLGAQEKLVGVTTYCTRPPTARDIPKVGSIIDVNVEKVRTLNPDLVIASDLTDPRQLELLKKLGIRVDIIGQARDFKGLCRQFLRLARLLEKEPEAASILRVVREDLRTEVFKVKGITRPKVFVQIGSDPLFTSGGGTLMDDMISAAGGANIAHDVAGPSVFSREQVVNQNPDIILVAAMDPTAQHTLESWGHYTTITAVKHNRIYLIDPYPSCSPTPLSFVEMVRRLRSIFHGA